MALNQVSDDDIQVSMFPASEEESQGLPEQTGGDQGKLGITPSPRWALPLQGVAQDRKSVV